MRVRIRRELGHRKKMESLNSWKILFQCALLAAVVLESASVVHRSEEAFGHGGGGGREVEIDGEGVGKTRHLRLTASSSSEGQDAQFQDELRLALNSHWEILQKIRYHTLISKMKVAQLDKKLKKLTQQIENRESEQRKVSSRAPCDKDPQEVEESSGQTGGEKGEVATLLASLKELSQFHESFNYTTGIFDQTIGIDNVYEKLLQLLKKMKGLVERTGSKDPGKRQTRKSTKDLTSDLLTTTATTMMMTTSTKAKPWMPQTSISSNLGDDSLHAHNLTAQPGATVSLKCKVPEGSTAGTVVWTKSNPYGGFEILSAAYYIYATDARYSVAVDAESKAWTLTIKDITSKDEGLYRCEMNSVSKNFHLIVRKELLPTIDVSHTRNVSAAEGTTAMLNCRVTDLGQYAVAWRGTDHYGSSVLLSYGNILYASNRRIGLTHHDDSSDWTLTIDDVSKADDGVYTCEVNTIRDLSQDVWLTVYESESTTRSTVSTTVNVTVHGGSSHTFNCTVAPLRNSKIFWIRERDQKVFSPAEKSRAQHKRIFARQEDSEVTSLFTVLDARASDEGEYRCYRDSNPSPTPVISELVQIVYLTVDMKPFITMDTGSSVSSVEGTTASLHCQISNLGNYTVAWVKLNPNSGPYILTVGLVPVIYDVRYSVEFDPAMNDWILTLRDIKLSDEGVYQCQINTHPVVTHSVTLHVIESQPVTTSSSLDGRFAAKAGEIALLHCRIQNITDESVVWVRVSDAQILTAGRFTLTTDHRFSAHTNDSETWFLQIADIREEDEGEYTCTVSTEPSTIRRFWLAVNGNDNPPDIITTTSTEEEEPTTTSTTEAPSCLSPFEQLSGDLCILRVTLQKLNWVEASEYCKSQEAELALDSNGVIQSFLDRKHGIEGENWTMWPFWVGAKEERNQDGVRQWKWIDGAAVDSGIWAYNQPRIYGKKKAPEGLCMTLDWQEKYAAIVQPCHYKRRFVCQRLQ